jgi:ELWxxDGT repeat protein
MILPLLPDSHGDIGFVVSDGTIEGTSLIRHSAGRGRRFFDAPGAVVELYGALYFFATSFLYGLADAQGELWQIVPGADQGLLIDEVPGLVDAGPTESGRRLVSDGAALWFVANDGMHGAELWMSDGSPGAARMVADLLPGKASSSPDYLVPYEGGILFAASDPQHGRELFWSDGTNAGTRLVHDIAPGVLSSSPNDLTRAGDYLYLGADDGLVGRELWALPLGDAAGCGGGPTSLCLADERFRVEASWRDFAGLRGRGQAMELTADTGYFWFFDDANVEVVVKLLDARAINDHFWVYSGGLSNVEYYVTVTDTETGSTVRYFNPAGVFGSFCDVEALSPASGSAVVTGMTRILSNRNGRVASASSRWPGIAAPCAPSPERLCLGGERFAIEIAWSDGGGSSGNGKAVPLTGDTGFFWFFHPANVEVVLKVLDGTSINGKFWVFYGALSDVEYTVRVTDTLTGTIREYRNPLGRFASAGDTEAF